MDNLPHEVQQHSKLRPDVLKDESEYEGVPHLYRPGDIVRVKGRKKAKKYPDVYQVVGITNTGVFVEVIPGQAMAFEEKDLTFACDDTADCREE